MQMITTTQLRTKSKQLVETLMEGKTVLLIHRSRVVGQIKPDIHEPKPFNPNKFLEIVKSLNLPRLTQKQIEKNYSEAMEKKHGKDLS